MLSVRLDPELDRRVRQAARRRGVSVSEFVRAAAKREAEAALAESPPSSGRELLLREAEAGNERAREWLEALDGIIGSIEGTGVTQEEAMDDWARTIYEHNVRE